MTSPFSDLLTPSLVSLDLVARNDEEAIRSVAGLLAKHPAMVNVERFASAVWEREKLSTTALGSGVAFPHARTDQVREIVMAVGRCPQGIVFPSANEPVRFVFVIGTPPDRAAQYLALVARLARQLKNEGVRTQLLAAGSAEQFIYALQTGG